MPRIKLLDEAACRKHQSDLADTLIDCVEGGASVSFMAPLSREKALAFWSVTADAVAKGGKAVFGAEQDGVLVGTVTLVLEQPENQPHRADLAKLLVRRRARRQGLGAELVREAEGHASRLGKTILVLDTVAGQAGEALYSSLGWIRVGPVPDYALLPGGGLCDTVFYYRRL